MSNKYGACQMDSTSYLVWTHCNDPVESLGNRKKQFLGTDHERKSSEYKL